MFVVDDSCSDPPEVEADVAQLRQRLELNLLLPGCSSSWYFVNLEIGGYGPAMAVEVKARGRSHSGVYVEDATRDRSRREDEIDASHL